MNIIHKLLFDLNGYVLDRYGGWGRLAYKYAVIRLLLKVLAKLLVYIAKEDNISNKQNEKEDILITENEKENLSRKERLKKYLRKILSARGGQLPPVSTIIEIARLVADNTELVGLLLIVLKGMRLQDLQVSIYHAYDLYMAPSTIQKSKVKDKCDSFDSLFGYLFIILKDDKSSSKEQADKIYTQLFDNGKLEQTGKNKKYIALFLACVIVFLTHFKNSGGTYEAFFTALTKALKTGKISKSVARRLLARLTKAKIHYPDELNRLVNS